MIKMVISAIPDTQVLANVYQLYIVENQCALRLINQSQGVTDMTVNANQTIYTAAHTVLVKIYRFPSSTVSLVSSIDRERLRILTPKRVQSPIVRTVQIVKNMGLRNPDFPFSTSSFATTSLSTHS